MAVDAVVERVEPLDVVAADAAEEEAVAEVEDGKL